VNSPDTASRNRLLAVLSAADRALLQPSAEMVNLEVR
jgi:hypothetical protein